jgi:GAF domain-containing protein
VSIERVLGIVEFTREQGLHPVSADLRRIVADETWREIAQHTQMSLSLDVFADWVTNLIRDKFGLYFVSLWLKAPPIHESTFLYLLAGSGKIASLLRQRDNRILISREQSPLSKVIISGIAYVAFDSADGFVVEALPEIVQTKLNQYPECDDKGGEAIETLDKAIFEDPLLPDTRSELALPLRTVENVIGALVIDSCVQGDFCKQDIAVFLPLADRIAFECAKTMAETP